MSSSDSTYVGQVASVTGGILRVRLRRDMPTTLVLVEGESYRVGQIGGFFRIPVGYTQLYSVCSQVGADAAPANSGDMSVLENDVAKDENLSGFRWMTVVLFGESVGTRFERGVGQYPTVGDEVHFVTNKDLDVIYGQTSEKDGLVIGAVASASGIPATLDLNRLVSRHCAIVGSTGSGKSNLVSVLLEALSSHQYQSSRVLVIDPHGEYSTAGGAAKVFRINPSAGEDRLVVPFWALPFDELLAISFGEMSPGNQAVIRDRVQELKRDGAKLLANPPDPNAITADSPVPFSLRRLWFELDDFERQTFRNENNARVLANIVTPGDASTLTSNVYEIHQPGSKEPFKNPSPRGIAKQLELAKSRMLDANHAFLFNPSGGYSPDLDGRITADLDGLVASWVGHASALTVLDVSDIPSEIAGNVVGLLLRIVYDTLFWAGSLPVGGKRQPLLMVIDEAHRFLTEGGKTSCHRILTRIAKEGRKYGVGLLVITQRPSEIDTTVLSQCGTMISLRITNGNDRTKVAAAFPDDLGGLVDLLPSLRTGEALFVGEAMYVPTRVRILKAVNQANSADPKSAELWTETARPDPANYGVALKHWRAQTRG